MQKISNSVHWIRYLRNRQYGLLMRSIYYKLPSFVQTLMDSTINAVLSRNGERLVLETYKSNPADYFIYLRHMFIYSYVIDNYIDQNSNVLEIGCGDGYGTKLISEKAKNIIGLDVDDKAIALAREKYEVNRSNLSYFVYDGQNINILDATFDVIVSFQVIEHVQDVEKYLRNIKRLLRPNGIFFITTPDRRYRLVQGQRPWNRFHLREYDPEELNKLVGKVFDDYKVMSISACDDILYAEYNRVAKLREDYDPKKSVYGVGGGLDNFKNKYSITDFYITEIGEGGLDLLVTNGEM